eukprot:GAHX01003521.1.p1 GENE.GAHX01003521.1~~GAHX01003521.1.p1  ORF type:complete len:172 (+),score=7.69 GAHX01003521.1:205-720(+)
MMRPKSICMLVYTAIPMLSIFIESNDAVISCKMETVSSCPNTLELWNAAAQRKNCSTDLCGSERVYMYHCLLTENLKQLVEVCTKPKILFDFCPYYDTVGKVIQRSNISCVSPDSMKNCTVYNSTSVYQYPVCYPTQGNTDTSSSGATRIRSFYKLLKNFHCFSIFIIFLK